MFLQKCTSETEKFITYTQEKGITFIQLLLRLFITSKIPLYCPRKLYSDNKTSDFFNKTATRKISKRVPIVKAQWSFNVLWISWFFYTLVYVYVLLKAWAN